jgi:hypothetical protein
MDTQLSQAGSGPGQSGARSGGLFRRLRVLDRVLKWLTAVFDLSDEEQDQAGVYLGRRRPR